MSSVSEAMDAVPRRMFLPETYQSMADLDEPLPIGFGQTNSQPTTVARMLEWLEVEPADKVLDIGSGSGWTTALLAYLVGRRGKVYAVEIVPELVELGRANCARAGIKNASFYEASPTCYGLDEFLPYDAILVSASADDLPLELLEQLAVGGKLVIPVHHDVLEVIKTSPKGYDIFPHPGYIFVPLVK